MNDWKAIEKWNKIDYLMKTCGYRTVPIELGDKYDNEDWSQGTFQFGDFLRQSILEKQKSKAYLAQHNLFDQIEELRKDFNVPEFCNVDDSPVIKSWIGPRDTISSMHTDDKHNIFTQVVGQKLVILANPDENENLYTHDGILSNTSQVDPENLNYDSFPLTKNVKFMRIIVNSGEMLFIPKLWFHYVRALTNSISVSFWFDE